MVNNILYQAVAVAFRELTYTFAGYVKARDT